MLKLFDDIGLAATAHWPHAARLIVRGNDPEGGAGSATVGDETDEGQDGADDQDGADKTTDIADDGGLDAGDEVDDEGRPIGRSGKTKRGRELIDELKSQRAKEKERADRAEERLRILVEGKDDDEPDKTPPAQQTRAERARALAEKRAIEIETALGKLDKADPLYLRKYLTVMSTPYYEDLEQTAEEVSLRTAESVSTRDRQRETQAQKAEQAAEEELAEQGFPEDQMDVWMKRLKRLSIIKQLEDPGWFKRTPDGEQIAGLVKELKGEYGEVIRNSSEAKEKKKQHRDTMGGVLDGSTTGRRGSIRSREDEGGGEEGPGSILGDLSRLRKAQRHRTNTLWKDLSRA